MGPAFAAGEARSGFSLALGPASFAMTDAATGENYSTGGGIGSNLDYQWALGKSFSVNLFYSEIAGAVAIPALPDVAGVKFLISGLQVRLWFDSLFVGLHAGSYGAVLGESDLSLAGAGSGSGQGLDAGIEGKGGWFLSAHYDRSGEVTLPGGPTVKFSGASANLGYRWK